MNRNNLPSLLGRRIVIAGDGAIAEAIARHAVAAGANIHLIGTSARAVRTLARDLAVTCTVADLTQTGPTEEAFAQAQQRLAGLDAAITVTPQGADQHTTIEPARAVRQTLELNAIPPALALGAATRQACAEAEAGSILIGSVLDRHPEEGFTTHSYAFATAPVESFGRYGSAQSIEFAAYGHASTPLMVRTTAAVRLLKPARVGGAGAPGLDPMASALPPMVDGDRVAAGCLALLRGHQVTAGRLRQDAPSCLN